jgi:cyclic pyranopterin phosphate synthase
MPAQGIDWQHPNEILTCEEIVRVAGIFIAHGITKIRLTGGEPTVRPDLEALIEELARLPGLKSLLMTTNGVSLKQKGKDYKRLGLTGLNISLDTLQPDKFEKITRRNHFGDVLEGIEAAIAAGFHPIKLNVVVMAGVNDDEILDFVHFVKDKPLNVRFIEFMPFKNNDWQEGRMVSYAEMKGKIKNAFSLMPIVQAPTDVAKDFAIEGFQGTISFITSMTENFCGACNRLRLMADGSIKSCLFFPAEVSLRDDLRAGASDAMITQKIREAVRLKPEGHAAMRELPGLENRSMIQIGG